VQVRDLFGVRSCDLTPPSVRHAARVLYAPFSHDSGISALCASVLSPPELQRADRYTAKNDKALFLQRRAFRRYCGVTALGSSQPLTEILFEETGSGRPYLGESPNLRFSFSSFRFGMLGAWSSAHGIGVDVEDQSKNLDTVELARQFFSVTEAQAVEEARGRQRLQTFYRYWSLKEAALKSIGEGLPFGLDAFEFELNPSPRVVAAPPDFGGASRFNACAIEGTGGCAALVIRDL